MNSDNQSRNNNLIQRMQYISWNIPLNASNYTNYTNYHINNTNHSFDRDWQSKQFSDPIFPPEIGTSIKECNEFIEDVVYVKFIYYDEKGEKIQVERHNVDADVSIDEYPFNWSIIERIIEKDDFAIDYLDFERDWISFSGTLDEFGDVIEEVKYLSRNMSPFTWKIRIRPSNLRLSLHE